MVDVKKIDKKDIKLTFTIKVYPYMQEHINSVTNALNGLLVDNFDFDTYNNCFFANHRGQFAGFNHSLAMEFLIRVFKKLNNDSDRKDFLIPELRDFIIDLSFIDVIDSSKQGEGENIDKAIKKSE